MRVRLRPAHSEAELARLYARPHDHTRFDDHRLRVAVTIELARWCPDVFTTADLSCGDAAVINAVPALRRLKGDLAPSYQYHGPIEQTISQIPAVDLFLCNETIEHLDDPDTVLGQIRAKTRWLVLSTPNGETNPDLNPEHYWGWDQAEIAAMLKTAGFTPVVANLLQFCGGTYDFQLWACQ